MNRKAARVLELIAAANAIISLSFFIIAGLIVTGLFRDRSLGTNPLGVATAFVFFTCASGHAFHTQHYVMNPELFMGDTDLWQQLAVDLATVVAGLSYLAQRRRFGLVIRGTHPMLDYQRRLQMAEALREIGQDIAAQTNVDKLLRRVVQHARRQLGADYAAIVALDAHGRPTRQVTGTRTVGWDNDSWNEAVFLAGKGVASRRPVVVADVLAASGGDKSRRAIHLAENGRSILAVPILSGDRVGGSLMVAWRILRNPTSEDVSSLAALASQAAVAIENARLIENLRQADLVKDEFLSAAAHELKTPVTAIKGWAEILLRPGAERMDQRGALETIRRQADRMTRLSEDLIAVARLQPGLPLVSRERIDVGALLLESVKLARRVENRREISLAVADSLIVEADPRLIAELLSRLLENAMRYSPAGRPVEVQARREGANAVVSVTDHGVGIPSERQAHVFEPFYEPVPPGKPGYVGIVSLGLHLSKQIVDAHGGRIWFANGGDGGATFSFSLPLA